MAPADPDAAVREPAFRPDPLGSAEPSKPSPLLGAEGAELEVELPELPECDEPPDPLSAVEPGEEEVRPGPTDLPVLLPPLELDRVVLEEVDEAGELGTLALVGLELVEVGAEASE